MSAPGRILLRKKGGLLTVKIERINDSQIRFVLTEEDLAARQIKLSELAYGTEKAKGLFREMMQQAASQLHFDVSNIPLMIEAIPMRSGSIVLIVSKVEHPEELDTRFSSFAPAVRRPSAPGENGISSFDQLLDTLISEENSDKNPAVSGIHTAAGSAEEAMKKYRDFAVCNRMYVFSSMDNVLKAASLTGCSFTGESILFRTDSSYTLLLKMKDEEQVSDMQQVLAALSEYGSAVPVSYARQQYLEEHGDVLIPDNALARMSAISG